MIKRKLYRSKERMEEWKNEEIGGRIMNLNKIKIKGEW